MQDQLQPLQDIIVSAAKTELLPRFRHIGHDFKADGSLITEADLATQHTIQQALTAGWPDYAFLGEEMPAAQQQALLHDQQTGLWCLDPLDGTSNFASGIPYFAISLALLQEGEIKLGLVYDPNRDECFTAIRGAGAWLNGEPIAGQQAPIPQQATIGLVDYKRLPKGLAQRLASDAPYRSQRSFGSVALDWCWLAAGRAHVYLHGRQNLWDYAAGLLVLTEAGGYSCTLESEPIFNRSLQPRSAVGAPNKALFDRWHDWLRAAE